MSEKEKKTKRKKRFWIIIGVILIVLVIILAGINSYLGLKIKNVIKSKINNNPDSTLIINYGDIDVNIYTGFIRINDLIIEPGKKKTDNFEEGKLKSIFSLKVKTFSISGVNILNYLNTKKAQVGKIKVKDADINILVNQSLKSDKPEKPKAALNILSKELQGVSVKEILFKNINLRVSDIKNKEEPFTKLNSLSISIKGVNLDSTTINNSLPVTYKSIVVKTEEFVYSAPKFYSINFSNLNFSMQDSTLEIANFQFEPKYSKAEYDKRTAFENDLFNIKTDAIIIHRLGIHGFIADKKLNIPSLEILMPVIDIYRNKRIADPPYKFKPLLVSLIKKIPIAVLLDTLKIKKGNLVYGELHEHRDTPGEVEFTNLYMTGYNITNQEEQISLHPDFRLDVTAMLMGKAKLQVDFKFDLSTTSDFFTVKGNLGRIDATEINRVSESMMMVKIKSGIIHKASFSFSANNDQSNGELILDYENLAIEVEKQDAHKKYKVLSAIANEIMNKNNMPENKKYKTGVILYDRNKNKAIPNYLWKSIQSGLVSIIATVAETKEQKEIQKAIKEEKKGKEKGKKKKKREKKK